MAKQDKGKDLREQFDKESNALRNLQRDIEQMAEGRQQYMNQIAECEMVQKEFELLENEAVVYKKLGPVLVKQEVDDARSAVRKRIEYMDSETNRLSKSITDAQQQIAEKQQKLQSLQVSYEKAMRG